MARPAIVRVGPREHLGRLLDGRRSCESRCRACGLAGRCRELCPGETGRAPRTWVPKIGAMELAKRLENGRRRVPSRCSACGASGPCHWHCPGDGKAVEEARARGDYVVTDLEPFDPASARAWYLAARAMGLSAAVYEPAFVEAFNEAFLGRDIDVVER